jgi:hypothetical protein
MTYSDSNHERRNLVLTSLAFIVYYVAGGKFIGDELKLGIVNIGFEFPERLSYFAVVTLIWFGIRFWQETHGWSGFIAALEEEKFSIKKSKYLEKFIKTRKDIGLEKVIRVTNIKVENTHTRIEYDLINEHGSFQQNATIDIPKAEEAQPQVTVLYRALKAKALFTRSCFSNYLIPYTLFAAALWYLF